MPHDVIMPALGMSQDTGLLVSWLKQPGDSIKAGDALMEVETDKAVMEVEAPADGFLDNVSAAAGDHVPVGHVVAIIVETANGIGSTPELVSNVPPASTVIADTQQESTTASIVSSPALKQELIPEEIGKPSDARVLASPKARRLALEQGLDINRLVELGLPQPYHVADLDALKNLVSEDQTDRLTALSATPDSPAVQRIEALVPADGCDSYIDWLANSEDIDVAPRMLWLRFAAAALRKATNSGNERMSVEIRQVQENDACFVDADRSGVSGTLVPCDDLMPMLVLFDLTGSRITAISGSVSEVPVLTIGRELDNYALSLDYRVNRLNERQAIVFLNDFAERLADPLFHLL